MEEEIYKIIKKHNCNKEKLIKLTNLSENFIDTILNKLLNEQKIFINTKNKYEIIKPEYIIGTMDKCSKEKNFVKSNNHKIIIPPEELHTALKNDLVVIVPTIIKRKNNKLVCEVKEHNNKLILVPFNGNCEINIIVSDKNLLKDFIIGDRCFIELNTNSDDDNTIIAHNINKIGHFNDKMNDERAIAISKDFDIDFNDTTKEEIKSINKEVTAEEKLIELI